MRPESSHHPRSYLRYCDRCRTRSEQINSEVSHKTGTQNAGHQVYSLFVLFLGRSDSLGDLDDGDDGDALMMLMISMS